jgi:hypothetical protein
MQDTNGLALHVLGAALGVSVSLGLEVNSMAIPRKAKQVRSSSTTKTTTAAIAAAAAAAATATAACASAVCHHIWCAHHCL